MVWLVTAPAALAQAPRNDLVSQSYQTVKVADRIYAFVAPEAFRAAFVVPGVPRGYSEAKFNAGE